MFITKRARCRRAVQGFGLGFLSVFGPLALFASALNPLHWFVIWLLVVVSAGAGGGAAAWMSRRRPPQGATRGLQLAVVAWIAALASWTPVMGIWIGYLVYLLFPYYLPLGWILGTVIGRILGPSLPHPDRETVRRFEAAQTERARRRLTSSRSAPRI